MSKKDEYIDKMYVRTKSIPSLIYILDDFVSDSRYYGIYEQLVAEYIVYGEVVSK